MTTTVDGNSGGTVLTTTSVLTTQGQVLQVVNYQTGAVATGTTTIPYDDTVPQNTEGTEFMSLAITPRSATSILVIGVVWNGTISTVAAANLCMALFQDSTASALASAQLASISASANLNVSLVHKMTSGTTSATTFKVRVGGSAVAGTTTFNGQSAARLYGGTLASSITITEVVP